jgi:hypothetical protein
MRSFINLLFAKYSNSDKVNEGEVKGRVARKLYKNNAYRGLLRNFEVNRPLETPRRMLEVDRTEIGGDGIHPSQYVGQLTALVNTVMSIRVP